MADYFPLSHRVVLVDLARFLLLSVVIGYCLPPGIAVADERPENIIEGCEGFDVICPKVKGEERRPDRQRPPAAEAKSIFSLLDTPNQMIALGLNGFARYIDEFLAAEQSYYYATGSYIRVTADQAWLENDTSGFYGYLRMKLNLPHTNEKYKFVIENQPDKSRDALDANVESPAETVDNQDYFVGLQAISGRRDRWRYRVGVGIKPSSPVDSYVRLGARRNYVFSKWSLYLDESVYSFDREGESFISIVELNRLVEENLLFRSTSRARWVRTNEYIETTQIFSLFQTLDQDRLVILRAGVYGVTEPAVYATDYRVSASLRKNLRQQYLFLELIPQIRYQKVHDFHAERGLILRLEWVFQG